ncbi:family 43 glycosylhydrolase [Paenibacillus gansuensis]|uniref:Family 43 glycosylhydrolase n=1 Tax=Paenibacillus gansuensis TaxID=306542 RepID=A0ABW5P6W8_9BACL
MRKKHPLQILLVFTMLFSMFSVSGIATGAATSNFYNIVKADGADPSVWKHTDGYYYSTVTTGGNVTLWRSKSISNLYTDPGKVIWTPASGTMYSSNIWAPEIQYINNAWYVYFAADNGNNNNHRMYALENTSSDPFSGTWNFKGKVADPNNDRWAIDGVVLQNGSSLYFIWSGWEGTVNDYQNIYIAPMSNPWTISGSRVKIASPVYSWETNTTPRVNEGPQAYIRNGKVNLLYSASGSWTNGYCLGLVTANASSNLLLASSWSKQSSPIFQSANGVYGPGHNALVQSPNGTENWNIYHAARWDGASWTRSVRAQKFTWNADNTPNLGSPVSPNSPIALAAGDSAHDRYEAEQAVVHNAQIQTLSNTSGGQGVGHIDFSDSYVEFTVNVPTAGKYRMTVRYDNGSNGWSSHQLSINGGAGTTLDYPDTKWGNWSNAHVAIQLNAGNNTIRFTKGSNYAQIDCIDIAPN